MKEPTAREGWIELLEVADPVEAELVRGVLEAEGVEVVVEPASFGEMPLTANEDFAAIHIWVPEAEERRAREVLDQRVPASDLERAAREAIRAPEDED